MSRYFKIRSSILVGAQKVFVGRGDQPELCLKMSLKVTGPFLP